MVSPGVVPPGVLPPTWSQVGELNDAGDFDIRLRDVNPEMRADGLGEFEDDADDADVVDGFVALLPVGGKVGDERGDERGWSGADDGVGGVVVGGFVAAGGCLDPGYAAIFCCDLLGGLAEVDAASVGVDGVDESVDEGDGAALEVTEFLLEDVLARAADAADASPDPGGGDVVGVLVEFVFEERLPQAVVDGLAAPADDPVAGGFGFDGRPGVAADADEGEEAVAELVDRAEGWEAEEGDGIAPGVERVVVEEAHGGGAPDDFAGDAELAHEGEGGEVGLADEVVEALEGEAVEVEVAGHSAGLGRGFDEVDVVAIFGGAIGCGEAHGSCSDDDDFHAGPLFA